MNGDGVTCMQCGAISVPADLFCEGCGALLRAVRRVAIPGQVQSQEIPCSDCGGATYVDDYCAACGNRRAEPAREQAELDGIVLITDRGLEHPRNEDAAAAGIVACASGDADRRRGVRWGVELNSRRHRGEGRLDRRSRCDAQCACR